MKKQIIAKLFICIFALCFTVNTAQAQLPVPIFNENANLLFEGRTLNEDVTLIIETENPAVVSGDISLFGDVSDNGSEQKEAALRYQKEIADVIEEECGAVSIDDKQYTVLFNGFAVKAKLADIEKIKSIDGVKEVYPCEDIKLEPHLTDTPGIISSLPQNTGGYTGKGQVIAIIDNEFDVSHPFFSKTPEGAKYSKQDIENIISAKGMGFDSSKVYVNDKIPFAYNYAANSYALASDSLSHGTHVAGIAAGSSPEEGGISGIAKNAQLVLMRVADEGGVTNESNVIEALEDAVSLGVSAVNISLGADYTSVYTAPLLQKCLDSVRSSGIFVSTSAGNKARGFHGTKILTDNIDYSSMGSVASFDSTFSVGSVNKPVSGNIAVASYSGYGVGEDLILNPDVSAPGSLVYSSIKGGTFSKSSGTSMASPHAAGSYAVMCEYVEKKHPEIIGLQKLELIEKLLMSAAIPEKIGSTEYSPRVQGAGVLNVASSVNTPVVLTGSDQKSKINLGDELTDSFNIKFTAENISSSDAEYDNIYLSISTDGYALSGERNIVSGTRLLNAESNLPQSIVIPAEKSIEINAGVKLDESQTAILSEVFANGFFIDGFVYFKRNDGSLPDLSIPFMGFYGDWTKAPIFDTTAYDEYGSSLDAPKFGGVSLLYSREQGSAIILGKDEKGFFNRNHIAISPNGDSMQDALLFQFTPMRTLKLKHSSILTPGGSIVSATSHGGALLNKFTTYSLDFASVSKLSEGDYFVRLGGVFNYSGKVPETQTVSLPFYVDKTTPEIESLTVLGDKISITAKDNRYLSHAYTYYLTEDGTVNTKRIYTSDPQNGEEWNVEFDLEDISAVSAKPEDVYVFVHDMAGNYYVNSVSCLTGKIHPQLSEINYTANEFDMTLSFDNYASAQSCDMLLGFYTNDGMLIHVSSFDDVSLPRGSSIKSFNLSAELDGASVCRLFMWEAKESLTPVDSCKSFNIAEDISQ